MAPFPSGTAACINFPLSLTKVTPSSKLNESDATKELYSPKE